MLGEQEGRNEDAGRSGKAGGGNQGRWVNRKGKTRMLGEQEKQEGEIEDAG